MTGHEEYEAANARATERYLHVPRAITARYDRGSKRVIVELSSSVGLFFSPANAQGLEHATADELSEIEISPSGYGLHFPHLDADLYLPGLLEGKLGSARWMAQQAELRVDEGSRRTG